jgi:hypothetical protein
VGCILALAFFANFPAWEVTRPEMTANGQYGPHFDLVSVFEHGWPESYVRRDSYEAIAPLPASGDAWKDASPWQPWRGGTDFSLRALAVDFAVWIGILLAGAIGT